MKSAAFVCSAELLLLTYGYVGRKLRLYENLKGLQRYLMKGVYF